MSSRERHPSTAWRPNLERCRDRLSEWLSDKGATWPELGAAVLTERGRSGMRVEEWANMIGVDHRVVTAAEAGTLPLGAWPARLQVAVPLPEEEWSSTAACAAALWPDDVNALEPGEE